MTVTASHLVSPVCPDPCLEFYQLPGGSSRIQVDCAVSPQKLWVSEESSDMESLRVLLAQATEGKEVAGAAAPSQETEPWIAL